jgi:phosphatidylglycerol lysyltransferase
MRSRILSIRFVFLITLGSGLLTVYSVIRPVIPQRMQIVQNVFSLQFIHLSRLLTLIMGFILVISAINIYKRKIRAYYLVLSISVFSILFHLTKGLNYEEATVSLLLVVTLILSRKYFTVKSSMPDLTLGILRFATALTLAFIYGVAGFWYLDRREFGINFHIGYAIKETFKYLILIGDPSLIPHTTYARWFLDSLYFMTIISLAYAMYALFRPVIFLFRTLPHERESAKKIVEKYGRSAMDFFKFWPDKSFFFSGTQNSFIAYRVANNFAIALADPVGPEHEIKSILEDFRNYCVDNDWKISFHQTLPDFLPVYETLGFRKLKIGDDAITDLNKFCLEGKAGKDFRYVIRKMEETGIFFKKYQPPIPEELISKLKKVSDEWLKIPGRRERQFTLGIFDVEYISKSEVYTAENGTGNILAFLNRIPSYRKGEATIDLMRRSTNSPNGIMDYLFVRLFLSLKSDGFERFNLGMAPMSGFQEDEEASLEEKAIHYFFQYFNFLFSYQGLKKYKAKFATFWEPRYVIHQNPLDLPRMIMTLREVSEVKL